MIIKTSELEGAALDCAVADANGLSGRIATSTAGTAHCYIPGPNVHGGKEYIRGRVKKNLFGRVKPDSLKPIGYVYSPSTDWEQGGPLIERYGVELLRSLRVWTGMIDNSCLDGPVYEQASNMPLVAAMRVIVAAELGDEIDVPDELGGEHD